MVRLRLTCACGGRSDLVARYSTGSNLNTYSALIQNFYSQETAPHQAIHLALNTGLEEGQQPGVQAYVGCVYTSRIVSSITRSKRDCVVQITSRREPQARKLCLRPYSLRTPLQRC